MILYEDTPLDDFVAHRRMAVLEAMEPAMLIHCYSNVDALEAFLDAGLADMEKHRERGWEAPEGLTRVALVFTSPRAVQAVARRMAPGFDFAAWPQPDAWLALYQQIDALRERARQYNPLFAPRYI